MILDVETTIKANGSPFHRGNKLCYVGLKNHDRSILYDIEYGNDPYGEKLKEIKQLIESCDLLVGFNIKFDLHWIRRYCDNIRFPRVWDCQLGVFLLGSQSVAYPSLDSACTSNGILGKLRNIAAEYWENGIDTTEVPRDELEEYLTQDLISTEQLYLKQYDELCLNQLFRLQCMDLLVLEEMEHNGMRYNKEGSILRAESLNEEISNIDKQLRDVVDREWINWNSSDHVSAILYGGSVPVPATIPTERVLKSGEIKHGTKKGFKQEVMERLVDPDPKSETLPTKGWSNYRLEAENAKRAMEGKQPYERIFSISKDTLRSLKAKGKAKSIIDLLLRRSEMEKLLSTYLRGIPKAMEELGNEKYVHGQFNQCVARTGRLSSSAPNLQNIARDIKQLFITRY